MNKLFLTAAIAGCMTLASVEKSYGAPTNLPLRYQPPGTCIGSGVTPRTVEATFGNAVTGLPFSATTNYDFYSPPLLTAQSFTGSDKAGGTLWAYNATAKAFDVTGRLRFYDYNAASGVDTLVADTGASGNKSVPNNNIAQFNLPNANLPANATIPVGHLLHIRVTLTLTSGSPGSNSFFLYNGANGVTGDSVGLLPQQTTRSWKFAAPALAPGITTQPANRTVCPGATASFSISASNAVAYRWRKNGTNLSDGAKISGSTSTTLVLSSAGSNDVASYDCVVSGASPCQSLVSSAASLTVNTAPAISSQPADQSGCSGSAASFSVAASGTGLTFQWRKNGVNLSNGSVMSGATTPTLGFSSVSTNDTANAQTGYDCVVSGVCGQSAVSTRAALTVSARPGNLAITRNADRTLTIAFVGTPSGNYLIQATSDPANPAWVTISNTVASVSGVISFRDLAATNFPARFYRAAAH